MKAIYQIIIIALLAVASSSCGNKKASEPAQEEHHHEEDNLVEITTGQYKTANIQLGSVEMKALSGTVKVNGVLDVPPQNLVSVSAPFGGFVKTTEMLQGMKVRKGTVVATLEHPDFIQLQQEYLDYKSQYDYQKLEYERQQELSKDNINSQKALQKSKSDFESVRAKMLGTKTKLQLMNVNITSLEQGNIQSTIPLYSSISGYVTQVNTNIGTYVAPTDVLFRIADTEHLHAELTVFEQDVPKLKIGQKVRFTLANETKERMATIYLIGREISSERTVQIHCHLDNEDTQLIPGMYLKALVESGISTVTAVPSQAIVEFQGSKYIFIQTDNAKYNDMDKHFEMIPINEGVSELGYTEIILSDDTDWKAWKVVTNGAYDILSQMKNKESEGHSH